MRLSHEPYYQDRSSVADLCCDFPADELLIEGLNRMQCYLFSKGMNIEIPVLRVMNTAHFVASYMFGTQCSGDQTEYDVMVYDCMGRDRQLTAITLITLAAMLDRTEGMRARHCRSILLEDRNEDFYEGMNLYERFIQSGERFFEEQDFMTDVMAEITDLRRQAQQLINDKQQLQKQLKEMENNQQRNAPVINVAGNYIDIHDNQHCNIYATEPKSQQSCENNSDDDICLPIPEQSKYGQVREYIEKRKAIDPEFKSFCQTHTRVELCEYLSKEFEWDVDHHALGRNINRNR